MTNVPGFKNTKLPDDKKHLKIYAQEMERSLDKGVYKGNDKSKAIHLLQTAKKELRK